MLFVPVENISLDSLEECGDPALEIGPALVIVAWPSHGPAISVGHVLHATWRGGWRDCFLVKLLRF